MPSYIDTVLKRFDDSFYHEESMFTHQPCEYLLGNEDDKCNCQIGDARDYLKSSLEHFAQVVEKDVIGEDSQQLPRKPGEEVLDQTLRNHRTFSENQLREHQRTKLKALLYPTQGGE